ncbi:hypothetical protein AVEN_251114-1 [Araneus ventricosus]|uniref:Uncharacterized protein n=1 Tax=Araneus ventricosus TaxID=182803 RepID=A0A4Y2V0R2_ARAVE|nr:hypothetical protein AVEN_251114-1 [Araneus ventricosus]
MESSKWKSNISADKVKVFNQCRCKQHYKFSISLRKKAKKVNRMCDNRAMWNYSLWYTHFYHQYLQQHARMTQWIQNLHQNLPQPWQNFTNPETQTCSLHNLYQHQQLPVIQQGHYSPQQGHYSPQQAHYIPQQGYYIPQQGHCIPQQGHSIPQQGHSIPQQGHSIPQQGHSIPQQGQHVHHQRHSFKHRENSRRNSHYNPQHRSRSQTSAEYVSGNEVDVQEEDDGNL